MTDTTFREGLLLRGLRSRISHSFGTAMALAVAGVPTFVNISMDMFGTNLLGLHGYVSGLMELSMTVVSVSLSMGMFMLYHSKGEHILRELSLVPHPGVSDVLRGLNVNKITVEDIARICGKADALAVVRISRALRKSSSLPTASTLSYLASVTVRLRAVTSLALPDRSAVADAWSRKAEAAIPSDYVPIPALDAPSSNGEALQKLPMVLVGTSDDMMDAMMGRK